MKNKESLREWFRKRISIPKIKEILKLMKGGKLMLIQFDKNNEIESKKEKKRTHCFNCKKNINSQQWDYIKGTSSCGSCFVVGRIMRFEDFNPYNKIKEYSEKKQSRVSKNKLLINRKGF